MKIFLLAVPVSVILLAGCKEETKSIDWYKQHPDETYEVYSKCKKSGEASANCEFAKKVANYFSAAGSDTARKEKFQKLIDE